MVDFASLKKAAGNLKDMADKLNQEKNSGSFSKDDRFWSLEVDKAGNGYAVIRFLPTPAENDMPYVKVFNHSFKVDSKWYIENCPTTIGGICPACNSNSTLWNSGTESNKKIASARKRRLQYIGNILVISDPKNPDNEGKVFLFKYGKTIFNMITGAIEPEFQDEVAMNPFDFWNGANFKLKAKKGDGGFRDLSKSEFEGSSALLGGDDAVLEKLWNSEFDLKEFIDPKAFKSTEVLTKKFDSLFVTNPAPKEEDLSGYQKLPAFNTPSKSVPTKSSAEADDDDLDAYRKLLEDDDVPF